MRRVFFTTSSVILYSYGKFGQSFEQALLQTSSCLHSSYVIEASIFFVGSSRFSSAARTIPNPKAPIPDFSKNASLAIQYAWAIRSRWSKFFGSSWSQGKLEGFQFCENDRSNARNICSFRMVQFPGKMFRA